jgi:predicted ABC-type ATPase
VPFLTVVAGPNGSGKSTLTSSVSFAGGNILIDPDAIARRLNREQPARAAIAAAREAILLCRAALSEKHTFVLETTLAGHGAMAVIREAKVAGTVRLSYTSPLAIRNCT